jgi:23S rRNA pseudouridine2605 synthase
MSRNEKSPNPAPAADKSDGERIAKYLARAGVCSRRDAEQMIVAGKVAVDGVTLASPAFKVTGSERITVEGRVIGAPQRPKMWRFHKPRGLVVSHKDELGRPTVFDFLKEAGLPRVISIGRLDLNSEGLLLLTNDGELARKLELPSTAWVRRYKVRVAGEIDANRLEALKNGITVDGVRYGAIEVEIDRVGGLNGWLYVSLTEGKNREIRRVLEHLGLSVNRLQRVSYGPFDIDRLAPGDIVPIGQPHVDALLRGDEVFLDKPPPKAPKNSRNEPAVAPPREQAPPRRDEPRAGFGKAGTRPSAGAPPPRGSASRPDEELRPFSKVGTRPSAGPPKRESEYKMGPPGRTKARPGGAPPTPDRAGGRPASRPPRDEAPRAKAAPKARAPKPAEERPPSDRPTGRLSSRPASGATQPRHSPDQKAPPAAAGRASARLSSRPAKPQPERKPAPAPKGAPSRPGGKPGTRPSGGAAAPKGRGNANRRRP